MDRRKFNQFETSEGTLFSGVAYISTYDEADEAADVAELDARTAAFAVLREHGSG